MAFNAIMDIAGTNYTVEDCRYSVQQPTDHRSGKPSGKVTPSNISVEIRVNAEKISDLYLWATKNDEKRDGGIKFFKIDEDASLFELTFEDGFCTGFSYHMSSHGTSDMTVNLDISARVIKIGNTSIDMDWHDAA